MDTWEYVAGALAVSLQVSFLATILACPVGVWIGTALALGRFRFRHGCITLLYSALAFPTVVVGLFGYLLLSRSGVFGALNLLYTRTAIVLGETLLIMPIIGTFTLSAVRKIDPALVLAARSLGAHGRKLHLIVIREARYGILAAVIASFGRAISEVGVAMILGGNIAGVTRTMTTAIAIEHDQGHFSQALILGGMLLTLSLSINAVFLAVQNRMGSENAGST